MRRGTVSGQSGLVALPPGVFRVRKAAGKSYWYFQARRGKPDKGPLIRLPEFGTPEFRTEYLRLTKPAGSSPRPAKLTVSALIADYKAQPAWKAHRPNTIIAYEAALGHILTAWSHRHPKAISVSHVLALLESHADRPSMANLVLVLINQLMKLAVQKGLRTDNPAREVDKLTITRDGAKPLSEAAWGALTSDDVPAELARLAILGRATGQRISDLVRMRPTDRDAGGINTTITKLGGLAHWCPLSPEEATAIDSWKVPTGLPFIHTPGGKAYSADRLRGAWNDYRETEAGAALKGFTPHDLRATKVCDERVHGTPHQRISAMVGMSLQMVMKYSSRIDQRLAARGTNTATQPSEAQTTAPLTVTGPLGKIHTLTEAAAHLRTTKQMIARVARRHGIGAVFGRDLRLTDDDIRAVWEVMRCPSKSSNGKASEISTSVARSEAKAFSNLLARATPKRPKH
ncbi:tyrosine-type recombinase/integrase [Bosea sp. 2RAB26]|uniref:tyrosine-type recombinase/integrase n=1 Tax=Bosea sp. 2RAB26 TaxID=3237476 RepID=UPI003F93915C